MQLLHFAALLAALSSTNAFNHRHVNIAKRQLNGALAGTTTATTTPTTPTTSSTSSVSASSSSSSSVSRSSSSSSSVAPPPAGTTTTTSAVVPPPVTTPPAGGTTTSSTSSIILTGDATLTASGVPPLASISTGMPTEVFSSIRTTFTPGASPPIASAPPIPTFVLNAADWPTPDRAPPTDSPEVQEWMKELDGYQIPDIPQTSGECLGSPQSAANAQANGWWTCGGWTRPTDILNCPTKMTWGVTFDDGPSNWTPKLLNYLDDKKLKSTFFVVGSRVIQYPQTLVAEYMAGHEIAVHTWSHTALTNQSNAQIVAELGWTRKAIKAVTGVTPVYMRPPYGDIDDRVRAISLAMGLVPMIWTRPPGGLPFDTNDWKVAGGLVSAVESYETFQGILSNATTLDTGFAVLEHDLFEQTVDLAVGYFLNAALTHNPPFTLEPMGHCNGFPVTDLYRETTTNKTFPYPNATSTDVDGDGTADTDTPGSGSGSSALLSSSPFLGAGYLVGLMTVLLTMFW